MNIPPSFFITPEAMKIVVVPPAKGHSLVVSYLQPHAATLKELNVMGIDPIHTTDKAPMLPYMGEICLVSGHLLSNFSSAALETMAFLICRGILAMNPLSSMHFTSLATSCQQEMEVTGKSNPGA